MRCASACPADVYGRSTPLSALAGPLREIGAGIHLRPPAAVPDLLHMFEERDIGQGQCDVSMEEEGWFECQTLYDQNDDPAGCQFVGEEPPCEPTLTMLDGLMTPEPFGASAVALWSPLGDEEAAHVRSCSGSIVRSVYAPALRERMLSESERIVIE